MPAAPAIANALPAICDDEALEAVLRKYTVFKLEAGATAAELGIDLGDADGGGGVKLTTGATMPVTFYVVRERPTGGTEATANEEAAVRMACKVRPSPAALQGKAGVWSRARRGSNLRLGIQPCLHRGLALPALPDSALVVITRPRGS